MRILSMILMMWLACLVATATETTVSNFAEFTAAVTGASDGDVILLDTSDEGDGEYNFTADVTCTKSVTIQLVPGVAGVVFDLQTGGDGVGGAGDGNDAWKLSFTPAAGTSKVVTVTGPLLLRVRDFINGGGVFNCYATNAGSSLVMNAYYVTCRAGVDCVTAGVGSAGVPIAFFDDACLTGCTLTTNYYGCVADGGVSTSTGLNTQSATGSGMDGWGQRGDGAGTSGTSVTNLYDCISVYNRDEGASAHDSSVCNAYGCTFAGNGASPFAPGSALAGVSPVMNAYDCYMESVSAPAENNLEATDGGEINLYRCVMVNPSGNNSTTTMRPTVKTYKTVAGVGNGFSAYDCVFYHYADTSFAQVGVSLAAGTDLRGGRILLDGCYIFIMGDIRGNGGANNGIGASCGFIGVPNGTAIPSCFITLRRTTIDGRYAVTRSGTFDGSLVYSGTTPVSTTIDCEGSVFIMPNYSGNTDACVRTGNTGNTVTLTHCTFYQDKAYVTGQAAISSQSSSTHTTTYCLLDGFATAITGNANTYFGGNNIFGPNITTDFTVGAAHASVAGDDSTATSLAFVSKDYWTLDLRTVLGSSNPQVGKRTVGASSIRQLMPFRLMSPNNLDSRMLGAASGAVDHLGRAYTQTVGGTVTVTPDWDTPITSALLATTDAGAYASSTLAYTVTATANAGFVATGWRDFYRYKGNVSPATWTPVAGNVISDLRPWRGWRYLPAVMQFDRAGGQNTDTANSTGNSQTP